jgi:hypothetical protein
MYYGYYGYSDGYNITSDLSVILNKKFNPSGLVKMHSILPIICCINSLFSRQLNEIENEN